MEPNTPRSRPARAMQREHSYVASDATPAVSFRLSSRANPAGRRKTMTLDFETLTTLVQTAADAVTVVTAVVATFRATTALARRLRRRRTRQVRRGRRRKGRKGKDSPRPAARSIRSGRTTCYRQVRKHAETRPVQMLRTGFPSANRRIPRETQEERKCPPTYARSTA